MTTEVIKKQVMSAFFALQPNNTIPAIAKHVGISEARVQKITTEYFENKQLKATYGVSKGDDILVFGDIPAKVHSMIRDGIVVKSTTGLKYVLSIDQFEILKDEPR